MKYKDLIEYANNNYKIKDYEEEAIYFLIEEEENISRSSLILKLNEEVKDYDLLKNKIDTYIYNNVPVQYITHSAYFYDSKFYVDQNVLIPRFDTEIVVEEAINLINRKYKNKMLRMIDVGTGSGCIAISLKKHIKNCIIDAIDISNEALKIAHKNAISNNVNINFIQNDLFSGIKIKYDVIISNPPYIEACEDVMDIVKLNEPSIALYSDDCGLYHYKKIIDQSIDILNDNGTIIFEIPDNKCDALIKYASIYYQNIYFKRDLNKQRRVLIIEK